MRNNIRNRNKSSKAIDIRLNEEKFYFPGETIKGIVTVHPKNPTKTNHIIVRFVGQVFLQVKDKETIELFRKTRQIPVSADKSSAVLDAKQHSFPFEFEVPKDLPSTMEFDKRKAKIKYTLVAVHDRPMVPESLCAKVNYTVPILELIDVTSTPFAKAQEKSLDVLLPGIKYNQKCQISMAIPRFGYTRGETIPLKMVINHFEPYTRANALDVEMVRTVEIRTQKNTSSTEDVLKTMKNDVKIIGPYNFSQSMTFQWMIPTSTPPTIRFKDKTLHIHYKIRLRVLLSTAKSKVPQTSTMEMPFVVGTWPRADIPIDDDDDGLVEMFGETMLSDDDDDDDDNGGHDLLEEKRYSMLSTSSAQKNNHNNKQAATPLSDVVRSNSTMSHHSYGSMSSRQSTHSLENLTRLSAGAGTGMTSSNNNNNMVPPSLTPIYQHHHLNRSSSTPDLLTNNAYYPQQHHHHHQRQPSLNQQQAANAANANATYAYYDHSYNNYQQGAHQAISNNNYQPSHPSGQNSNNAAYYDYYYSQQQQQQQQQPVVPPPLPVPADDVPTRVLEEIKAPAVPTHQQQQQHQQHQQPLPSPASTTTSMTTPTSHMASEMMMLSDDDDDSDDDGDLLALIEKKKKQALREMRQRQLQTVLE